MPGDQDAAPCRWGTIRHTLSGVARFTHLALDKDRKRILRAGIKPPRNADGVYAMPVLSNFFASHQWLRELKRQHSSPLIAIDFVIDDVEPVRVGHYSTPHASLTAAEAIAVVLQAADARGYEVLIPRKIDASAIRGVRHVPQVVGWRYWPDAHGNAPCRCDVCQRGAVGGARVRSASTGQ
jgi:hypothetical protein